MHHRFTQKSLNERPAMRVMVLAWAAAVAQTPVAAWAWFSCLALGLAAARFGTRPAPPPPPAEALRDLKPAAPPPARRRTDAPAVPRPPLPVLKARDDLTGLTTPQDLGDAGETWAHDLQARGLSLCVLHVGLDGLDPVIERYGQDAGNQVLQQVARRLRQLARDEDRVMRFDGNEFVLLLACPDSESRNFARNMAARIRSELQRPLAYRTLSKLEIGCSVGPAIWPLHGDTLEAVIRHAADALAAARSRAVPHTPPSSQTAAA
jgi:diguanylate cyclase (GGDEF)-like protein